jgi:phosphoserine phosphatase
MLDSWTDGSTKSAIVDFVGRVTAEGGPDFVEPEARVAVFDNDGTLWCEKPAYIQLDFIVRRLAEKASADPTLAQQQPYRAAAGGDLSWFGNAITRHYQGDDGDVKVLAGAVMSLHQSMTVEQHAALVSAFYAEAKHPTLGRPYSDCTYAPMVELLRYLEAHGFTCYIVSGGGRDFMRPISQEVYGIPRERVIGSATTFEYASNGNGGALTHGAGVDYLDDGPQKPIRIWGRTGRRPMLAAGNSNGDIQMLEFAHHQDKPLLRLLVLHDDDQREFDYTSGAEQALETAGTNGWTVVSMKNDWSAIF